MSKTDPSNKKQSGIHQNKWVDEIKTKSTLMLVVHTNGLKTDIVKYDEARKAYVMEVAAPPQDNKANIEIAKYFSKKLGKKIKIISGATAKKKLIRLN